MCFKDCFFFKFLRKVNLILDLKYIFNFFPLWVTLFMILIQCSIYGSEIELMIENRSDRRTDFSCLHCIKCTNVTFKSKYKIRSGCKSCSV